MLPYQGALKDTASSQRTFKRETSYYQHSCEDQRECFGGWERFTELESIQWLADGEPANDREGASGVLQLKGNDPMEGATENSLQML